MFVLLFEPLVEGLKVFEHGTGVEWSVPVICFRVICQGWDWPAVSMVLSLSPAAFAAVEGASVEWAFVTRCVTHCLVELELVDAGEEVAGVGDVAGDVIFGAGVEVGFGAGYGWGYALIFAEGPPALL